MKILSLLLIDIDKIIKELDNEIDKCKNNNNNIDDKNDDIIFKP